MGYRESTLGGSLDEAELIRRAERMILNQGEQSEWMQADFPIPPLPKTSYVIKVSPTR